MNIYIYIYIYMYIRWRNFFFTVKNWNKKIKKINFINLFGLEVKKNYFFWFYSVKLKKIG